MSIDLDTASVGRWPLWRDGILAILLLVYVIGVDAKQAITWNLNPERELLAVS